MRGDPIGFQVQRLNHSAIAAYVRFMPQITFLNPLLQLQRFENELSGRLVISGLLVLALQHLICATRSFGDLPGLPRYLKQLESMQGWFWATAFFKCLAELSVSGWEPVHPPHRCCPAPLQTESFQKGRNNRSKDYGYG